MPRTLRVLAFLAIPACVLALTSQAPSQNKDEILGKTKTEWIKILQSDTNPEFRRAAVIALGISGPTQKDVLLELNKALQEDKSEFVRLQVIAILGTANKSEIRDLLSTFVDVLKLDKSASVRAQMAALIGKLGANAKPAISSLENALKDENAGVRAAAVSALGAIGPEAKGTLDKMVPLFRDADSNVRFSTAYAVARIGADPLVVVPYLNQLVESDMSVDVRREATKSIGLLGAPTAKIAVPVLVKALRTDKEEEIRRQAALALGTMGNELNQGMKEVFNALREEKDKTVRVYLIRSMTNALGRGMKYYVKELAEHLAKEMDGNVRLAIVQELGALGPDAVEALPALVEAETDLVLAVREAARTAQEQIRKPVKKDIKKQ